MFYFESIFLKINYLIILHKSHNKEDIEIQKSELLHT